MELTAVIRALESLKRGCAVALHTDSQYVKNGIETWIHNWKKNGWKTADRKPVKNAELWRELDALAAQHDIRMALGQGPQRPSGQRSRRRPRQSRRGVDKRALTGDAYTAARAFPDADVSPSLREPPREHLHLLLAPACRPRLAATSMPVR